MHAMYSTSSVGTHHIFFPPRLQVVVGEDLANGLAPHVGDNPPASALLGGHADRPPRIAIWGRSTNHRDNRRLLASVQQFRRLRTRIVGQRRVDAVLDISPAHAPHLAWVGPQRRGDIRKRPRRVEQLENSDPLPGPGRYCAPGAGLSGEEPPIRGTQLQAREAWMTG